MVPRPQSGALVRGGEGGICSVGCARLLCRLAVQSWQGVALFLPRVKERSRNETAPSLPRYRGTRNVPILCTSPNPIDVRLTRTPARAPRPPRPQTCPQRQTDGHYQRRRRRRRRPPPPPPQPQLPPPLLPLRPPGGVPRLRAGSPRAVAVRLVLSHAAPSCALGRRLCRRPRFSCRLGAAQRKPVCCTRTQRGPLNIAWAARDSIRAPRKRLQCRYVCGGIPPGCSYHGAPRDHGLDRCHKYPAVA